MFGISVGIDGDTIVVGAHNEDSDAAASVGAMYVFARSSSTWVQETFLKATNGEMGDSFGCGVGIDNKTIVVAAHNEDSGATSITNGATASENNSATGAGAVYVFFNYPPTGAPTGTPTTGTPTTGTPTTGTPTTGTPTTGNPTTGTPTTGTPTTGNPTTGNPTTGTPTTGTPTTGNPTTGTPTTGTPTTGNPTTGTPTGTAGGGGGATGTPTSTPTSAALVKVTHELTMTSVPDADVARFEEFCDHCSSPTSDTQIVYQTAYGQIFCSYNTTSKEFKPGCTVTSKITSRRVGIVKVEFVAKVASGFSGSAQAVASQPSTADMAMYLTNASAALNKTVFVPSISAMSFGPAETTSASVPSSEDGLSDTAWIVIGCLIALVCISGIVIAAVITVPYSGAPQTSKPHTTHKGAPVEESVKSVTHVELEDIQMELEDPEKSGKTSL